MAAQRVTRKQVDAAIDLAETRFERCWRCLVAMKAAKISKETRNTIHTFQPLLATALFDLSRQYVALGRERQLRIESKSVYTPTWFKSRLSFLSQEQQRLIGALQIGRSIGDAFAFFFYQNDLPLLGKHVRRPALEVMSTGTGGTGELEAAKNMQMIGASFVLHHCITSILRLGDISLIDLKSLRVRGVGELKSHSPEPGCVTVSVSAICQGSIESLGMVQPTVNEESGSRADLQLNPAARDRLQRQMEQIQNSQVDAAKKPNSLINLRVENRMTALSTVLRQAKVKQMACQRAGRGQVLFAYRLAKRPLSKRLRTDSASASGVAKIRGMDELLKKASQLVQAGRSDNAMLMGFFFYERDGSFHYLDGMTHPFWWPLAPGLLRPVIFREVVVGSAYNPAMLYSLLEDAGFVVDATDPFDPKVSRQVDGAVFIAGGMRFYLTAIQRYLMDETAIVDALLAVYKASMQDPGRLDKRIDIKLHQRFGEPPAE